MTKFLKRHGIVAIALLLIISSCGDEQITTPDVNFDRKAMFQNIADNTIVPEYSVLKTKVVKLDAALNDFTENPDSEKLQTARAAFQTAYLAWQHSSPFLRGTKGDSAPGEIPLNPP